MSASFGPAGNSLSFYAEQKNRSTLQAPRWIVDFFGLDCYEYQCGHGVRISEHTARLLGARAQEANISLSLHAPYFINLANPDPVSIEKNQHYILASCRVAHFMNAKRIVIHSGARMKQTRQQALDHAKRALKEILPVCEENGYGNIALCPETMGKINQLGDLDEVLELCTLGDNLIPCIDFGHLYARSLGELDGYEAYVKILDRIQEVLGAERASHFHSHFSHIEFTPNGGEKCHRTFEDCGGFGPDWVPLAREIVRRNWSPTFICESAGTQAEDAKRMKEIYQHFLADFHPQPQND